MQRKEWLLLTDVDGTLDYQCTGIQEPVLQSANFFVNAGGNLALATGRAIISTKSIARNIGVNTLSILYGGAMIYDFQKEASQWICPVPDEINFFIDEIINKFTDVATIVFTERSINIMNDNTLSRTKGIPQERDHSNFCRYDKGSILKINFVGKRNRVEEIRRLYFLDSIYNFSFSSQHFAEVVSENAGKHNAMKVLSELLNIPMSRIIAMGDGHNDIEMLRNAGISLVVDNASSEVKRVADIIVPNCFENGAEKGFKYATEMLTIEHFRS